MARTTIPLDTRVLVLTEAGYRCAVPTCRTILAIDLHHIVEVSRGGGHSASNLLALCPTCHALYHRGTIKKESIRVWKQLLVALTSAFDKETLDHLLFLDTQHDYQEALRLSGDAVMQFSRLIGANLAEYYVADTAGNRFFYSVQLTDRGKLLLRSWKSGNVDALKAALPDDDE